MKYFLLFGAMLTIAACTPAEPKWRLMLKHDEDGQVLSGDVDRLIGAVRNGCALRVAWGSQSASDERRTIEHISTPLWVAVRNGETVEVQLDDYFINLGVLGEPEEEHPQRERFGGTSKAVMWRVNYKTDGTFDAVWYDAATGEFITRVPQTHPGSWFADCAARDSTPLYQVDKL